LRALKFPPASNTPSSIPPQANLLLMLLNIDEKPTIVKPFDVDIYFLLFLKE
jgi:hypothetical protein